MFLVAYVMMLTAFLGDGHVHVQEHPSRRLLAYSASAFHSHTIYPVTKTANVSFSQRISHHVGPHLGPGSSRPPTNVKKNTPLPRQPVAAALQPQQLHEKRPRHEAGSRGRFRHARKGSRNGTRQKEAAATKGGRRANFRCCRQVPLTNLSAPRKRRINPFPERDGRSSNESSNRTHSTAKNSTPKTATRKCVDCRRALLSTADDDPQVENVAFENATNRTTTTTTPESSSFVSATAFFEISSAPQIETHTPSKIIYQPTPREVEKFTNNSDYSAATNDSKLEITDDDVDDDTTCSNCSSGSDGNRTAPVVILTEADAILTDAPDIWNQEKYLTKGINPNIEVSIEILHRDVEANRTAQAEENLLASVLDQVIRANSEFPAVGKPVDANVSTQTTQMPASESQVIDMCHHWMQCPGEHKLLSLARLDTLPTCPCQYSFSVHYNEQLWDERHGRYFRWRDASGPHDKLQVYQPGARWCIRSLVSETSTSLAAQHCCYDNDRCLITRGAGAGTPNFVSPEVSRDLHYRVDILPWIVCKGDWSRYHKRRPPNNENECPENPSDKEYAKQEAAAKEF